MLIRRQRPGGSRGFTLIELLSVIGITVVLAALLVPTVSIARKTMERTKCANNLKQIGVAIGLYASDHNATLPSGVSSALIYWDRYVDDYMPGGHESGVFTCPTEKLKPASNRTNYIGNSRVLVDSQNNKYAPVPLYRVLRPAEVIMVMDGAVGGSGSASFGFYDHPEVTSYSTEKYADRPVPQGPDGTTSSNAVIRWRHNVHINALFVDGHVDSFGVGDLKQRNIQYSY